MSLVCAGSLRVFAWRCARPWWAGLALLGAALAAPTAGYADADHGDRAADAPVVDVLFIGNSYTRYNDLPKMVRNIARSVDSGPRIRTRRLTHGGFDLRRHWRRPEVRQTLRDRRWDCVVLQDHSLSPLNHPDRVSAYARRFRRALMEPTRVILFQPWARQRQSRVYRSDRVDVRSPEEWESRVHRVLRSLADELRVDLAPVGRAWRRARYRHPEVALHRRDGTHPDVPGTYLSALVIYGTVSRKDPRRVTWRPYPLRTQQAMTLRDIASETLASQSAID